MSIEGENVDHVVTIEDQLDNIVKKLEIVIMHLSILTDEIIKEEDIDA